MAQLMTGSSDLRAADDHPRLTRRDLLRALGVGGAAVAAGAAAAMTSPVARFAAVAEDEPPIDPEIEQLAFDLDLDPEAIFRFVADEVRYDAYPGSLRGAKGTLWGLAGNSADQALLLADLLRAALVDVRFVTGELSEDRAAALLASLTLDVAAIASHAGKVFSPRSRSDADEEPPALTPEQETAAQTIAAQIEPIRTAAQEQLAAGVGTITEALAGAGIALPEMSPSLPERERRQHVWVQYRAGTDWIDLDPSMPNAEAAVSYATASATLDRLPDDWHHQIVIRSVAEVVASGKPARQELLSHQVRSQDLVGKPVSFFNAAPEALAAFAQAVSGLLEGTKQYVPFLLVGTEPIQGSRYVTFLTGEGMTDVLGQSSSSNEGDTLAQWLEIDVLSPDAALRTVRREIFDRVGVEQRAAGEFDVTTIPPVELVDLGEEEGLAYPPALALWSLAIASGPTPWQLFRSELDPKDAFPILSLSAHAAHYLRETLAVDAVAALGYRSYLDAPNIAAFVAGPTGVSLDGIAVAVGFDLLHRSWQTVPLLGTGPAVDPRIQSGVLSHVAERIAMGEGWTGDGTPAAGSRSVGRIFDEAVRQGIAVRVLAPGGSTADDLGLSPRAKVRVGEALAAGCAVIVPERAVDLDGTALSGWWKVELATGLTLDELETGAGTDTSEETINLTTVQRIGRYFTKLGCVVQFMYIMAAVEIAVAIPSYAAGQKDLAYAMGATAGLSSAAANALKQHPQGGKC